MTIDTDEEKLSLLDFIDVSQPAIPLANDPLGDAEKRHLLWGYAHQEDPVDHGLGRDISGRNNHWTVNDVVQQLTDTPTNNFNTLNPVDIIDLLTHPVFSNGNRTVTSSNTTSASHSMSSTIFRGPTYFEGVIGGNYSAPYAAIGVADAVQKTSLTVRYEAQGIIRWTGGSTSAPSYNSTDTIRVTYDPLTDTVSFYKNNSFVYSHILGSQAGVVAITQMRVTSGTAFVQLNFGNPVHSIASPYSDENGIGRFDFPVISGFFAPCTQNLEAFLDPEVVDGEFAHYVKTRSGVTKSLTIADELVHSNSHAFIGTSSLFSPNDNSRVILPTSADWNFGSGDFSLGGKFRFSNLSGDISLIDRDGGSTSREWRLLYNATSGRIDFNYSTTGSNIIITESDVVNLAIDTDYEIDVKREGNNLTFYLNKTAVGTVSMTDTIISLSQGGVVFAGYAVGAGGFTGFADDIYIQKGAGEIPETGRINIRPSIMKLLIQSRDMPDGNTEISDHDIISDAKFPVEDDRALAIIKPTNGVGAWDTARRGKKRLVLNDTPAEIDSYNTSLEFLAGVINGNALGNGLGFSREGEELLDWIMNAQDPLKYGIEMIFRTGTGSNATTLHNGGQVPSMRWTKPLTDIDHWYVYHKYMDSINPDQYVMTLSTNAARFGPSAVFFWKAPTATEYYTGTDNAVNKPGILYLDILFFDIPFLQSAFYYLGNNNINGPCIILDHISNLFFIKRYDAAPNSWFVWDQKRSIYNPADRVLFFNESVAEGTGNNLDILASGLKIRLASGAFNQGNLIGFSFGTHGPLANAR